MGHTIRTVAVLFLAIALLAWFMRGADFSQVWLRLLAVSPRDLALAASLFVPMMFVRALRWRCLLRPVGPVRVGTALRTTVIGFAVSNILPARAGEVLRPYLLARMERLSVTSTFATVVVERVLDLVAVLALLGLSVWSVGDPGFSSGLLRTVEVSATIAGAGAVFVLALMWVLASHPESIGALVLLTKRVLPHAFAHGLSRIARLFSEGLAVSRMPGALSEAVLWSFALWVMIATQSWMVTSAFGIEMPFTGSFLLQALLVVGIALPTPGGVGGFHEAYRIGATTFFRAPGDAAVGAALVLHAISFIPTTLMGAFFMVRSGLSIRRLRGLTESAQREEVPVSS